MTKFINLISVVVLGLLLMTCTNDSIEIPILNDTNGTEATDLISSNDTNTDGLDFDALIREVEAEVSKYEDSNADGYWSRSQDKIDKEAELLKEYNTERQWIIDRIEENKWWFSFNDPNGWYNYERNVYLTPDYFNTPAKREAEVDKAINIVYRSLTYLYKLEFLKYKHKQLHALSKKKNTSKNIFGLFADKQRQDYDCGDIEILKKINKTKNKQWKSFGNLGLLGQDNPYAREDGKGKKIADVNGNLTEFRQAKLKLEAVKYIKRNVLDATPPSQSYNVPERDEEGNVTNGEELWEYVLTRKIGWRPKFDINKKFSWDYPKGGYTQLQNQDGKYIREWYDGLNYGKIWGSEKWQYWRNDSACRFIANDLTYPVETCARSYFNWEVKSYHNKAISYSDFENRKETCN